MAIKPPLQSVASKHPLQSMCSYLGCFPPRVPQYVLEHWMPQKNATILDPFCGSGTTLVEYGLQGHWPIGVDLNPLAVAISRAKLARVELDDVLYRIMELARDFSGDEDAVDLPNGLETIFHPRTLAQLAYLRRVLGDTDEDVFLRGAILGIMHGKHRKDGSSAYLSIDMPNTFSMSPEYVRGFVEKHRLKQLPADVFRKLSERVRWLLRDGALPIPRANVIRGDATQLPTIFEQEKLPKVDAVLTSPPYLGILRYGAFNWIRLWFLGVDPVALDRVLDSTDSVDRYLSFITSVLLSLAEVVKTEAPVILVIGDVVENNVHLKLASYVWENVAGLVPFDLERLVEDHQFDATVKTTRIWGEDKKGRATPMDRLLVLRRSAARSRRKISKNIFAAGS